MFFSKSKKESIEAKEQREQYEYAHQRVQQKKNLMRHFIIFLVGSVFLIIINPILGIGDDFFIKNWFVWAILIWAFIFLIHLFNVFVMNTFMGKEWENLQIEKLKNKQEKRIQELQQKVDAEMPLPKTNIEIKKNEENQTPLSENL